MTNCPTPICLASQVTEHLPMGRFVPIHRLGLRPQRSDKKPKAGGKTQRVVRKTRRCENRSPMA